MGQFFLMYIHCTCMIIRHGHTVSVNWACGKIITQKQYDTVLLTFLTK